MDYEIEECTEKLVDSIRNSSDYRHVDAHTCHMLGMDEGECWNWILDFLAPMREKMKIGM